MPLGWECRAKLIKQNPAKPTRPRGKVVGGIQGPGPMHYDQPEIFCGKGYSRIKRSPAYTFGYRTPVTFAKSVIKPTAPMLDTSGMGPRGRTKIKLGIVSPPLETPGDKTKTPGPGAYVPRVSILYKKCPAFTMQPPARPPYKPWDQWTPSPNMYLPPQPGRKCPPAYTFGSIIREKPPLMIPPPGAHDPKFNYVKKNKPAFSFGGPFKSLKEQKKPAPNAYCEKKFHYTKPTIPAPSFGIRHSPYIGRAHEYLKPPELSVVISGED